MCAVIDPVVYCGRVADVCGCKGVEVGVPLVGGVEVVGVGIEEVADDVALDVALPCADARLWFIENPQTGRMKDYITDRPYYDVDYCRYCDWGVRKRTRVWTNKAGWLGIARDPPY